jgi:hypothetical protein
MLIIEITKQTPIELIKAINQVFDETLEKLNQKIAASTERLNTMRTNLNQQNTKL